MTSLASMYPTSSLASVRVPVGGATQYSWEEACEAEIISREIDNHLAIETDL